MMPDWQPMWMFRQNIPVTKALLHDGTLIKGEAREVVKKKTETYLRQIGYHPSNFVAYFETAICRAIPAECGVCKYVDDQAPEILREPRTLRMGDVLHFLGVMQRWVGGGMNLVPTEEAQRRSDVCNRCPYNQQVSGCAGCVDFAGKVAQVVGGQKVAGISTLNGCAICGCSIPALIQLPIEALGEISEDHPTWCWKVQGNVDQQQGAAEQTAESAPP